MAELKAKIGSDSSEFRNDVNSLPAVVKKNFKEMKDASDGGIAENVKGLKKGFADFKDVLVGGGIVEAVKRFFDFAIESARKSTDANDMNAAAVRRFGDALLDAKEAAGSFAVATVGTFNRIGESIGQGIKLIGGYFSGTAAQIEQAEAALSATEKAARSAELSLERAKKHAAEFNQLTAESKALTEARADAERKALSLTEQRDILQTKLLEAQRAEVDAGDNVLARRKAQVEQLKIGNQLLDVQKGINDEQAKTDEKRRGEAYARHKIELDGLELAQKAAILTQEIADAEALIASGSMDAKGADEERVRLADRRAELLKTQNKISDEGAKIEEESLKLDQKREESALELLTPQKRYNELKKQEAEILTFIASLPNGPDKIKEENRLLGVQKDLRSAASDVAARDREIAILLLKGAENLTDIEKERLKLLLGQTTELKQQAEISALLANLTSGTITPAERERLAVLTGQTTQLKDQQKTMENIASLGRSFKSARDFEGMSTEALQGMLQRDEQGASDLRNPANNYIRGGPVTYLDRMEAGRLEAEATNIRNEIAQRKEVSSYARRYGEDATVRKYGDALAEKALNDVRDTSTRTANAVETLSNQISSVFPKK